MTPREALTLLEALDVPFADELIEVLDGAVTKADDFDGLKHWAGVELESYLVSIGQAANPAASTGNEHLDWLTEHLI